MEAELVALGKVTKPHGLRGVLKIVPYFPLEPILAHFHRVWLTNGGQRKVVGLEWIRQHGRVFHLKLEGYEDADAVEQYRGWSIAIPRKELPSLPQGQYYTFQIIGLSVITENGQEIGLITEVLPAPAHDIYVVQAQGREVMIPAVRTFVKKIDLKAGQVIIRPISGLMD